MDTLRWSLVLIAINITVSQSHYIINDYKPDFPRDVWEVPDVIIKRMAPHAFHWPSKPTALREIALKPFNLVYHPVPRFRSGRRFHRGGVRKIITNPSTQDQYTVGREWSTFERGRNTRFYAPIKRLRFGFGKR